MKKFSIMCLIGASVLASNTYAGFGSLSLSSLASQVTESVTGVSSNNVDISGLVKQAQATNKMFLQSRTSLALLLADRQDAEELKTKLSTLKTTSNVKEKDAIQQQIVKLTDGVLKASEKDEAATVEKINALNTSQKQQLLKSMTNFALAGLTARELVANSKGVSTQIMANPSMLTDTGLSLTDAKGLMSDISGIAKNSTMALVEYPQLLKKAGVSFKVPESTATKPQDISAFL